MTEPAANPPNGPEESPRAAVASPAGATPRLRFDRNELAGSFGDIGTDLPLIIGILLATGGVYSMRMFTRS